MAELRITDLVDEKEIEKLKELNTEMTSVVSVYKKCAQELAKGLSINVECSGDVDKLNSIIAKEAKTAQEATEKLNNVMKQQNEIVAKTTNTISRELAVIEKENAKKREAYEIDRKAIDYAKQIIGTRDQNIERLVKLNAEIKSVSEEQKKLDKLEQNGVATTQQLLSRRKELTDQERTLKAAKADLNLLLTNEEKMNQAAAGSYTQLSLQ